LLGSFSLPRNPGGGSSNISQPVTIPPDTAPGSHYVWVILDVNNSAGQTNTSNDKAETSFTISAAAQSDLVPISLTITPMSGASGSTATVNFTIYNQGSAAANPSTTHIRLNTSAAGVTTSDALLASVAIPTIPAAGSYNISQSVTIPTGIASGVHYVWVILDVNNTAGQSNTNNDKAETGFTVASTAQSDLIPLSLTVTPTSGASGSTVTVNFTIYNQGSGASNPSTTHIRLNTSSSSVTTSDALLASLSIPALSAGASYNISQPVTIPSVTASGAHYVWVILDVNNVGGQSNTNNDKAETSFTIASTSQSDLVPQGLTVSPTSGTPGSTITVSFTIYNQGSGASNPSTTHIRLNTSSSSVTTSDALLASLSIPALSAGASYNISQPVTIPSVTASGAHYVWVILDVNNVGRQRHTNNDKAETSFTIASTSQSDLVPQGLTVSPTSGTPGSTLTVSFTIYNQGSGASNPSTTHIRLNTSSSSVTTSDALLASLSIPALSAGASYNISQPVTIPSATASGAHYVWVILDVNNVG